VHKGGDHSDWEDSEDSTALWPILTNPRAWYDNKPGAMDSV
jgi:hypothetical protein